MLLSSMKTGLGLRRELLDPLKALSLASSPIDFLEVAPENWIDLGGPSQKKIRELADRYPIICHGLSLSLGGLSPLNISFLKKIRQFLEAIQSPLYSEHLSYCSDHGYLYDLLPMPFSLKAARHVARRVQKTQDMLKRRIAIENISYYLIPPGSEMTESEFIIEVLQKADCLLLLDVNNVYVNSINHRYDPLEFLRSMPSEKIAYLHLAGHLRWAPDLLIDTHGSAVIDPVWDLFEKTCELLGVLPTLLERDFNLPHLQELLKEVRKIRKIQNKLSSFSLKRRNYGTDMIDGGVLA